MPTYDWVCHSCDDIFEKTVRIADRDNPQECPSCGSSDTVRTVGAPTLMDPVRAGVRKPDQGFREILHKIHEKNPGSVINQNPYF